MSSSIVRLDVFRSRGEVGVEPLRERSEDAYAQAVSVEQLRVLTAVADAGSFSAAARALNKTQSNVSYHVASLEAQLEVALFDRAGRKPCLTPQGKLVIAHARRVLASLDELRSATFVLAENPEPRISVVMDRRFPPSRLLEALSGFRARHPGVAVCIEHAEETRDGCTRWTEDAQIGVFCGAHQDEALIVAPAAVVEIVPVVAPSHPLSGHVASDDDLCRHPELACSADGLDDRPRETAWHVASEPLRLRLLRAGLGWARMPRHIVDDDLARGTLVALQAEGWGERPLYVDLYVARRRDRPLGPAGQWLFRALTRSS